MRQRRATDRRETESPRSRSVRIPAEPLGSSRSRHPSSRRTAARTDDSPLRNAPRARRLAGPAHRPTRRGRRRPRHAFRRRTASVARRPGRGRIAVTRPVSSSATTPAPRPVDWGARECTVPPEVAGLGGQFPDGPLDGRREDPVVADDGTSLDGSVEGGAPPTLARLGVGRRSRLRS